MSSELLAQFLGLYLLVVISTFLLRREQFTEFLEEFADNRSVRYIVAYLELAGGLIIVLTHNVWTLGFEGLVTVIGWLAVLEAVFHLTATDEQESRLISYASRKEYWLPASIIFIALGVYLTVHGFNLFGF